MKRLLLLNDQANTIFLHILEHGEKRSGKLPLELGTSVRAIAASLDHKNSHNISYIRRPEQADKDMNRLLTFINDADAIMKEPLTNINREIPISKPFLKTVLAGAFDKIP